jgi:hypothetical protein
MVLVFADRIAALTDWISWDISATLELGEQVRTALSRVQRRLDRLRGIAVLCLSPIRHILHS